MLDIILFYLILARVCKWWSKTVQIHSIIHCILAFLFSHMFLIGSLRYTFSDNISVVLQYLSPREEILAKLIIYHSIGYFTADTIDILISKDPKRYVYIFHHIVALIGLIMVFWGSYLPVFCIWILEMGGMVHHIKYAAEIHGSTSIIILSEILYHTVYVFSRLVLAVNIYYGFLVLKTSPTYYPDLIGLIIGSILIVQNMIWWSVNMKKFLRLLAKVNVIKISDN